MIPPEEIHHTRHFTAPKGEVFRAFTDAELLADWWGRHDFTNPECEFDARPGGRMRIVMRSPEGLDYPLLGTVLQFERPARLMLDFDLTEFPADWRKAVCSGLSESDAALVNEHRLDLVFTGVSDGTRLDLRYLFPCAALRDAFQTGGVMDGWNEAFDALNALLTRSDFPLLQT